MSQKATLERGRWDQTEDLPPSSRRLDSLAALLAAESLCVAVAVINGKLCVTANELYNQSRKNRVSEAIEEIAKHFTALAAGEQPDREKTFKRICSYKRLTNLVKGGGGPPIPEDLPAEVATLILNHQRAEKALYDSMYRQSHAAAFGLAYGEYIELHRDFRKLEDSIKEAREVYSSSSSTSSSSSPSFSGKAEKKTSKLSEQLFQALSTNINILKNEPKSGVHAEMQMLSYILTEVVDKVSQKGKTKQGLPTKIYIGISKLCCLNCRVMLDAANTVFQQEKIPIHLEFRGRHDLNFSAWECPLLLSDGYNEIRNKQGANIAYKIGKLGRKNIDAWKESAAPSHVSMQADLSQSDTESITDASRINRLKDLKNFKDFLEGDLADMGLQALIAVFLMVG